VTRASRSTSCAASRGTFGRSGGLARALQASIRKPTSLPHRLQAPSYSLEARGGRPLFDATATHLETCKTRSAKPRQRPAPRRASADDAKTRARLHVHRQANVARAGISERRARAAGESLRFSNGDGGTPRAAARRTLGSSTSRFFCHRRIEFAMGRIRRIFGAEFPHVWVIGGLAMFARSRSWSSISARYTGRSGMYVWSKLAFGRFGGFMTAGLLDQQPSVFPRPAVLRGRPRTLRQRRSGALPHPRPISSRLRSWVACVDVLNIFGSTSANGSTTSGAEPLGGDASLIGLRRSLVEFGPPTHYRRRVVAPACGSKTSIFWSIAFAWTPNRFVHVENKTPRAIPIGLAIAAPRLRSSYSALERWVALNPAINAPPA